jgi:hypothetical protein
VHDARPGKTERLTGSALETSAQRQVPAPALLHRQLSYPVLVRRKMTLIDTRLVRGITCDTKGCEQNGARTEDQTSDEPLFQSSLRAGPSRNQATDSLHGWLQKYRVGSAVVSGPRRGAEFLPRTLPSEPSGGLSLATSATCGSIARPYVDGNDCIRAK